MSPFENSLQHLLFKYTHSYIYSTYTPLHRQRYSDDWDGTDKYYHKIQCLSNLWVKVLIIGHVCVWDLYIWTVSSCVCFTLMRSKCQINVCWASWSDIHFCRVCVCVCVYMCQRVIENKSYPLVSARAVQLLINRILFGFLFFSVTGSQRGKWKINIATINISLCCQTSFVISAIKKNPYSQF